MKERTRTDVVLEALGLNPVRLRGDRAWFECMLHEHDPGKRSVTMFVRRYGKNVGRFYCFSCKKKGGLAALASLVRSCDLEEAVEFVRKAGKGFAPPRMRVRVVAREPLLSRRRFEVPREVVLGAQLEEWPSLARAYWIGRGLDAEDAAMHGVGYATHGAYANRIVIPFVGERGVVGTVSARSFVDEDPKYKTPHESDAPDLDVLFGASGWPPVAHRRRNVVIVTEGALDAISVQHARMTDGRTVERGDGPGPVCLAALGGSDVRAAHVLALATFGGVIVATDADPAGERAARRLVYALAGHAKVFRLALPSDANDMLRRRPRDLAERISSAIDRVAP